MVFLARIRFICEKGVHYTGFSIGEIITVVFSCLFFPMFLDSTDIDECNSTDLNNCDTDAACLNTPGSFQCVCLFGYTGNGTTCDGKKTCYALSMHPSHCPLLIEVRCYLVLDLDLAIAGAELVML